MRNKPIRLFYFVIAMLLLLTANISYGQTNDQQIAVILSNDKFADQDKYFTSGLYFTYQKTQNKNFILPKTSENKLQLNIGIGNEIYSPASLSSFNTDAFDRPFAGWLFGKLEVGSIKEKSAIFLAFETGITGEESLAGDFQIGLHEFFGIDSRPTWVEQIEFKWLFNIKTTHIFDWRLNDRNTLQYHISPSLGTKDIYLENAIGYYFGRFNSFKKTARIGTLDGNLSKEFFGYISAGYKYVVHNTLIQGSIFTEDVLFTTGITNHILKAEVGAVLRSQKNTFKIIYNFNTKETPLSGSHVYGSLFYARRF